MMPESHAPVQLKEGALLKYKKRFFKSNWPTSDVALFSDATLVARRNNSSETVIHMADQTTLIIFGYQLKDVPKKPMLPPGYRVEQLLAIGLMQSVPKRGGSRGSERMTIIFHWFLPLTIHDLFDWVIAINSSIPNNKQLLTNDELTMSLVMAEAVYYDQLMMQQLNSHVDVAGLDSSLALEESGRSHAVCDASMGGDNDDYFNDAANDAGFDCVGGEFDDCSAFAAADAFAIF